MLDGGETLRVGATVGSDALVSSGWCGIEAIFFSNEGCGWDTVIRRDRITGAEKIQGTTGWKPYSMVVTAPENAVAMKLCPQIQNATGNLYADHLFAEQVTAREDYVYDGTHTYRTATTTLRGSVEGVSYDEWGRSTEATHADAPGSEASVETSRTYDGLGRLEHVETAPASSLGIEAFYRYTAAGRLETITDPLGRVTTLTYEEGRLSSVTSPSGIRTQTGYDDLGRLESLSAPYRPDDLELVIRNQVEFAYDSVGRVEQVTYFDEFGGVAATQSTEYDSLSRPRSVVWTGDVEWQLAATYDVLGRATAIDSAGPAGAIGIDTVYDKASLPTSITTSALGTSSTLTNTYAKTGQWQTTQVTDGNLWTFTSGSDGTLRRTASTAAMRELAYNTALELVSVRLASGAGYRAEETIACDQRGRVDSTTLTTTSGETTSTNTDAYHYDEASRLDTWTRTQGGVSKTTDYGFDAAGNLTSIDAPGETDDVALLYDTYENWLLTSTVDSVTTTYTTNDYGRRTGEETGESIVVYEWDSLGHLVEVTSQDSTSTYEYGPTGMREKVTVTTSEETSTTESVWAGMQLALERDSDGTLYRFLYGPSGLPLEMIVTAPSQQPASYTYQCDRAGSVIALTDANGAVVATYSYDPWGDPIDEPSSGLGARNPLRYRGYYYDSTTEHYYLPARYYDPATVRFLSPDPAAPSAGDPLSLNRYTYCVGDPINASDPSGAVHVAGDMGARVSKDAVKLAKAGHLEDAKKVQDVFRSEVSSNYAKGYDFVQAGRLAELSAEYASSEIWTSLEALAVDATWDNYQDGLAGASLLLSSVGLGLTIAGAGAGGVGAVPGLVVLGLSGVVSGANMLITLHRQQAGYIDDDRALASYTLGVVSCVPVMDLGASIGGAAIEWTD